VQFSVQLGHSTRPFLISTRLAGHKKTLFRGPGTPPPLETLASQSGGARTAPGHSIALQSVGCNLDHVSKATCQKDVSLVLLTFS